MSRSMKTFIITLCVLSIAVFAWLSVPHWPRSAFQDYVLLYLNDKKLQKLITEADKTPYNIIRWLPDQGNQAGVRSEAGIIWEEEPALSQELLAAFEQFNTNYFMLVKSEGFWGFPGFTKIKPIENNEINGLARHRQIDYVYRFGGGLIFQECGDQLTASEPAGRCDRLLFGDWVLEKTWFVKGLTGD
ncbi:hypothetical protein Q3O59_06875 [Alkalimonas delamerensis]|uniref:DUF4159 domain-containing protein n=1 Tax=Alkalimonas delamerensis TaxID=265981 RepID=A0ABT9GP58_9GAMM|nr:hypothetical protein [Alkalimonas delamerensis]MDP4528755.1 hypothetical protein [Alkalimonas delamerensis]